MKALSGRAFRNTGDDIHWGKVLTLDGELPSYRSSVDFECTSLRAGILLAYAVRARRVTIEV